MTDMGIVHGHHLFYTGGKSIRELLELGEIVAIPDAHDGIAYKRPERCTELELLAKLTVPEAEKITAEWNARLDNNE